MINYITEKTAKENTMWETKHRILTIFWSLLTLFSHQYFGRKWHRFSADVILLNAVLQLSGALMRCEAEAQLLFAAMCWALGKTLQRAEFDESEKYKHKPGQISELWLSLPLICPLFALCFSTLQCGSLCSHTDCTELCWGTGAPHPVCRAQAALVFLHKFCAFPVSRDTVPADQKKIRLMFSQCLKRGAETTGRVGFVQSISNRNTRA